MTRTSVLPETSAAVTSDGDVTTIAVTASTSVPPSRVLELTHDFSARRSEVFPAVPAKHLKVHSVGTSAADATEGTRMGPFVLWERCDYDWAEPGRVTATVTGSNVYAAGSVWQITATPSDGGSEVTMTWTRRFVRRPLGRFMGVVYRRAGKKAFAKYAAEVLRNMERIQS